MFARLLLYTVFGISGLFGESKTTVTETKPTKIKPSQIKSTVTIPKVAQKQVIINISCPLQAQERLGLTMMTYSLSSDRLEISNRRLVCEYGTQEDGMTLHIAFPEGTVCKPSDPMQQAIPGMNYVCTRDKSTMKK